MTDRNRVSLFEIFDPIVREVCRLVKEQVNDAQLNRVKKDKHKGLDIKASYVHLVSGYILTGTQAIFLVGGFGSNKYILEQVTKAHPRIQVIQPNDA